ncbi:MAG: thiol:disulfide interchange protein DsbG [Pseudolabrys sp.]
MLLVPLGAASAATTPTISTTFLQKALHMSGPIKILKTEPGPAGLTAVLISVGGHKGIVWVVGNDAAVVLGDVRDAKGDNLTKQAAISMGLMPKPIEPAAVAKAVTGLDTFVIGSKGPEVTVFFDPNCIYCHEIYEKAQPLLKAGTLRLRVVMVGFLKPTSFAKSAAILMQSDRAQALATDENKFDVKHEEGGIAPAKTIPAKVKQDVEANTHVLAQSGDEATPTLLYQNGAGQWQVVHGMPDHGFKGVLAEMKAKKK